MKDVEPYTDINLIRKILDGEIALFEILVRRNNSFLYKIGRSYNYNHEDTQDLMQETFLDAYTSLSKFENRSSFKTWVTKIMLHNCYRKKEKLSFKNELTLEFQDEAIPLFSSLSYADTVMNKELNSIIENALLKVPFEYRMVFSLREINGMKVSETAEILKITEANVKVRLNRAKTLLRKEVEKFLTAKEVFEFNLIYCDEMVNRVMNKVKEIKDI